MVEIDQLLIVYIARLSVILIDFILTAIMLRKTFKVELKITKTYFSGVMLFFCTHGVARLLFFLRSYYFIEIRALFLIGTVLGLLSLVFITNAIESVIYTKSKHIFTYYGIIGVILMIIFSFIDGRFMGISYIVWVQYLTNPVLALVIILIYFGHIFQSMDKVRTHFILITIAIILIGLAEMGNTSTAHQLLTWTAWVAPLMLLTGMILIYIAIVKYYKQE